MPYEMKRRRMQKGGGMLEKDNVATFSKFRPLR